MNEVLVDISVWVDHFRHANESLIDLLSLDMATTHPMVVATAAVQQHDNKLALQRCSVNCRPSGRLKVSFVVQ